MNITIVERFRPFSHLPGTYVLVPGSDWLIQVFPTTIKVGKIDISICKTGPVKGFTVQSDLEKECVRIWGTSPDGYFRLEIFADAEGLKMRQKKEHTLLVQGGIVFSNKSPERLFLGCHKAQDWDLARRRLDSKELAPALFLLGQKVPAKPGNVIFDPKNFTESFSNFYLSHFSGLFAPSQIDPQYLGIQHEDAEGDVISGAYAAIRSLLIQDDQILPNLPPEWVSGRMIHVQTKFGLVDFEWSRGWIRRLFLYCNTPAPFIFSKDVGSCRVRKIGPRILYDKFQK